MLILLTLDLLLYEVLGRIFCTLSDFRKYDNQFSILKTTFSTSDSIFRILICILKLIVESTTEFQITDSSSSNFTDKQFIFINSQSDHADLSDHLINTFK